MTYTISRAEQVLQTQRQALNLRWYPHYHLAARAGWINDPNGLVWFDGWYHAFYQHHPYSTQWGPMHWGHARSKDLVHWEHLPVALAPEGPEDKDGCFSGSAVVDGDTLALIYTGHKFHGDPGDEANLYQVQCLATSRDGIHFERQGMVVDTPPGMHHFRDPKVWREGDSWYMIVGAREGDTGQVRLYRSADLRQWQDAGVLDEAESTMGYMWECPDFFTLNGKRVLMFSPQGMQAAGFSNRNLFQAPRRLSTSFAGRICRRSSALRLSSRGKESMPAQPSCCSGSGDSHISSQPITIRRPSGVAKLCGA